MTQGLTAVREDDLEVMSSKKSPPNMTSGDPCCLSYTLSDCLTQWPCYYCSPGLPWSHSNYSVHVRHGYSHALSS